MYTCTVHVHVYYTFMFITCEVYGLLCFLQVVGNRGSVEITPRLAMQKECIITGMLLFNASQVSAYGLIKSFHHYVKTKQ